MKMTRCKNNKAEDLIRRLKIGLTNFEKLFLNMHTVRDLKEMYKHYSEMYEENSQPGFSFDGTIYLDICQASQDGADENDYTEIFQDEIKINEIPEELNKYKFSSVVFDSLEICGFPLPLIFMDNGGCNGGCESRYDEYEEYDEELERFILEELGGDDPDITDDEYRKIYDEMKILKEEVRRILYSYL